MTFRQSATRPVNPSCVGKGGLYEVCDTEATAEGVDRARISLANQDQSAKYAGR